MNLNKKEINKNTLIDELIKKINKLEEKNKNLENEIKEIKEKQKEFENLFKYEIEYKKKIRKNKI